MTNETQQQESTAESQQSADQNSTSQNETMDAYFSAPAPIVECRNCQQSFDSKNKLHKYLQSSCKTNRSNNETGNKTTKPRKGPTIFKDEIVESDATEGMVGRYGFRG